MSETLASSMTQAGATVSRDLGGKYLTCHLGEEEYCLDILSVQEIIAMMQITRVPRSSPMILGVINLRGKIIPIVDLRRKFGMEATARTKQTCIIVVESRGVSTGIVVDRVTEVVDIASEDIEPTPVLAADVHSEFILGLGKIEERVLLFLNIDQVLTREEIVDFDRAGEPAEPSNRAGA